MIRSGTPLYFFLASVACQLIGLAAVLEFSNYISSSWTLVFLEASIACASGWLIKLPKAWLLFNFLIAPGILLSQGLKPDPWWFGIISAVLLLLYLPTFWSRVPFYPTRLEMYQQVANLLPQDQSFKFIDLGCGTASLLIYLARKFPQGEFFGVEISPFFFLIGWLRSKIFRGRVIVRAQSIWLVNLEQFDFAYVFLAPPPMPRIWAKANSEMRPGSKLLVNSFPAPAQALSTISIGQGRGSTLFVYQLGQA